MSKYDKNILKKKEIIIFNKIDLLNKELIDEKLQKYKKKSKKKFEIVSLITNENLEKIKKNIYKQCI